MEAAEQRSAANATARASEEKTPSQESGGFSEAAAPLERGGREKEGARQESGQLDRVAQARMPSATGLDANEAGDGTRRVQGRTRNHFLHSNRDAVIKVLLGVDVSGSVNRCL